MIGLASLFVGLLPVVAFLVTLIVMDSYRLVRLRTVLKLLFLGVAVALSCLVLHRALMDWGLDSRTLSRYVAPVTEEVLKGLVLLVLVFRHRFGFLVDAAIGGFAVGAGFAAFENIQYFLALADPRLPLWIVRGFGTAILHGGLSALVAISTKQLLDLGRTSWSAFAPGLAAAILLHSTYNHFFLSPLASALLILLVLPATFAAVYLFSERATRQWLGTGFDTDSELLELIRSGQITSTRAGIYLGRLRSHFDGPILVDMLCLIRVHLELSIQAKGLLLAKQAGFAIELDRGTEARLEELRFLERSLGRTGLRALEPIFNVSSQDLWKTFLLEDRSRSSQ